MAYLIQTDRLLLREFQITDAQNFYLLNADPDVIRYTGDPPFKSIEDAALFLKNYTEYQKSGFGRWAVLLRSSHQFIGWCGLKQHSNYVDLGFRFFKKEWNKGYATEAAKACLEYAFHDLDLPTIVGRVSPQNAGSIRVLEKIGMSFWKTDACKGISDALYYRINRDEIL